MSETFNIATFKGDGIGPDVINSAIEIIEKASNAVGGLNFEWNFIKAGAAYYKETGKDLEDDGEKKAEQSDAIFLGAIGLPSIRKDDGTEIEKDKKQFLLTWVQPGLAGLMDGSVSTLAPIFATAFATMNSHTTLLVGLAASIGAGISMGFTEAVHDDGIISGRGSPVKRGFASGVMTTLGGLGHALPYLITDFYTATVLAILIVFFELWLIAWIQNKYMKISFSKAIFQVVFGGSLVLGAGILIGGV